MVRLIDRNRQIPNGLRYLVAETGWQPSAFSSFDTIVRGLIQHRMGNPYLTKKNGWSTDYETVANEVDLYNAMVCQQMGWTAYYVTNEGIAPPPKLNSPGLAPRLRAAAAGAPSLLDWLGEGGAVPAVQSEARATVCVSCPQNKPGELLDFFTEKAANFVKRQLEKRNEMKLSTSHDAQLGICQVCFCPLHLKVHSKIQRVLDGLQADQKAALPSFCWIVNEEKSLRPNS